MANFAMGQKLVEILGDFRWFQVIFKHCDVVEETSISVSFGFMSTKTYLDTQLSTGNSKKVWDTKSHRHLETH